MSFEEVNYLQRERIITFYKSRVKKFYLLDKRAYRILMSVIHIFFLKNNYSFIK